MIDVLLTHSYHLSYDAKQLQKMQPYRPLGTLYAANSLRARGLTVAFFDTMLEDPKRFSSFVDEASPKIIVIYEDDFNFLTKMCLTRMREVVWDFTLEGKIRRLPIIVHGSDASDHPELFLDHGIDYVLRGEAEATLSNLCCSILRDTGMSGIPGVFYRDTSGKTIRPSTPRSQNAGWASLPMPALEHTDFDKYRAAWKEAHGFFSVNLVASRGCPFRCNWCAKPISGDRFQLRPPTHVAEEMRALKFEIKADHLWFSDDVFALNHHWMKEFADEVVFRDCALPFKIQSRADLMTQDNISALKQAGCVEVWMGVESGSQAVLDAMNKGLTIADVKVATERLKTSGIRACYFLQFGYPGEHWEDLQKTIALVRTMRPNDIGVSFSYPLPGTAFYERTVSQLGSKRNWVESDDLCILFQAAYRTDFYRAVRDALHAEVDSWTKKEDDASSQNLWAEIHAMEPFSRSPVPTQYRYSERTPGFVTIDQSSMKAGA